MRVAIVGCGKVADKHAAQIRRFPNAQIVGVCDREELMARQLAERMGVERWFCDLGDMLAGCQPHVVHVTTPPQSHYALARQCLEFGCHVYVEKPFTITSGEAERLIHLAEESDRKITVGHETQFTPVAMDLRRLVGTGYLGGAPVHMESVYCYDFSDERYAAAVLGDGSHWVRGLPGGLLQNIISHGIGKLAEYLRGDEVDVMARGFRSRFLEGVGESSIEDELRVIIVDGQRTTAYFTFSSQIGPPLHQFRVFGPKNSVVADLDHQTLVRLPGNYKSYLNQFLPPFQESRQYAANGWRNVRAFLGRRLHTDSGMHTLLGLFYEAIAARGPVPIPYKDILMTSRLMDTIFGQLRGATQAQTG